MAVLPRAIPSVLRDPRTWRPVVGRTQHWTLAAFVVAHALAVVAGRATRLEDTQLALVWPAAAVAVLWMLHARASGQAVRHGVALALTTSAGNLLTGASPALAVAFGAAAVLQGCVTVSLLPAGFRLRTVAALGRLVLAGTAGSLASAGLGSLELRLLADVDLRATFGLWAVRNTASVLVLVAVALRLWDDGPTVRPSSAGRGEATLVLAVLGLGHALLLVTPAAPAGVLLLPVSIWIALRWSTTVASLHALSTATLVVVLAGLDRGPFAAHPPALGMVLALLFVLTVALVVLSIALTSDERADLVQRLRSEQRQSAAQALMLETVLDTVDVAIVASDAAGRPVLVNRTARALHDLDDDGPLPDAVPVGRVLVEGRLSDPLLVVEVPGRGPRTVRSEGRALLGPDGTLLGAVVVQTDVTALCASEQQFRAAFEDGPTPTARLDDAGRVEQTNAALRRLLSLPSKRLLGRELADLALEEDRGVLRAAADDPPGAGPVEVRLRRADGGPLWCEVSRTLVRSPGAAPYVLTQVLDVHARKRHELALEDVAHRDALTGLDNRHVLDRRLGDLLVGSGAAHVVLAYLDLDGFKAVNDVHGHDAGDAVLRAVGERLLGLVRADDVAARLGGDEFVVACSVPDGQVAEHVAAALAGRIEQALSPPVAHGDLRLELGVSVGTAVAPATGDPTELLHRADLAMYERKRARTAALQAPPRWRQAPLPDDEAARLDALRGLHVLDTPPEQVLDELCEAAALVAGVPAALVSLVDEQRQWCKARWGLDAPETGRDVSFCAHVVALDDELHVEDARRDDRFADNPLVAGDPGIRSYAGFPLRTPAGLVLGSLCVIGYAPALLPERQRRVLRVLADQATSVLLARPDRGQLPAQRSSSAAAVGACAC